MDNSELARIYFEAAANITEDNLGFGGLAVDRDGLYVDINNSDAVKFCALGHIARVAKLEDGDDNDDLYIKLKSYIEPMALLIKTNEDDYHYTDSVDKVWHFNDDLKESNDAVKIIKNKMQEAAELCAKRAAEESLTIKEPVLA